MIVLVVSIRVKSNKEVIVMIDETRATDMAAYLLSKEESGKMHYKKLMGLMYGAVKSINWMVIIFQLKKE